MPSREKLVKFTAWWQKHADDDEAGQAQIFRERFFQAFGYPDVPDETIKRECETNRRFTSAIVLAFTCN